MKLKDIQNSLRPHGITVKKTGHGNEHRVAYKGKNQEASAYYTDDPQDAHDTGHRMALEARMRGEGSHDPMYPSSKKNY